MALWGGCGAFALEQRERLKRLMSAGRLHPTQNMANSLSAQKRNLAVMTKLFITILVIAAALFVVNASRRWQRRHAEFIRRPPRGEATDADVERFVAMGRKITAIKLYREIHGVGLKEAKEAVEELARKRRG
jgi:ribosomal protein L7/L12